MSLRLKQIAKWLRGGCVIPMAAITPEQHQKVITASYWNLHTFFVKRDQI